MGHVRGRNSVWAVGGSNSFTKGVISSETMHCCGKKLVEMLGTSGMQEL